MPSAAALVPAPCDYVPEEPLMSIVLGPNQYGKAENRVVRIYRDTDRHEIRDLNVSTSLRGEFTAAHTEGDQASVLPTDTQKNTAFAFAKEKGVSSPEDYALALADRFVDAADAATAARVEVEEYAWDRITVDGQGHDHAFVRRGGDTRTTVVTIDDSGDDRRAWVVSGLKDLVVLKSTGSEFKGFLKDEYTTLAEADDRIMATSLVARWRYEGTELPKHVDWNAAFEDVRRLLMETFAVTYSRALQETLYAMGRAVLEAHPEVAEIKLSAPNKHHFLVDLSPFGLDNRGEVFIAADRPYGLIEATVTRDDASPPGDAWLATPGFC
jgi:urate oxidase